jgi:hypothetical protein
MSCVAKVNESEPVDALGKVENRKAKIRSLLWREQKENWLHLRMCTAKFALKPVQRETIAARLP